MRTGGLFTCDTCGAQAVGIIPTHHVNLWPPARWIWSFGGEDGGLHACSRVCWDLYQRALREANCKIYISDSHNRWDKDYPPPHEYREVGADLGSFTPRPEHMKPCGRPAAPSPNLTRREVLPPRWRRPRRGADVSDPPPEPPPSPARPTQVRMIFFAQRDKDGAIKIGMSWRVDGRMAELGAACGQPLRLLGMMPGGKKRKAEIMEQFKDWQLGGEWFAPTQDLLDFVAVNRVDEAQV